MAISIAIFETGGDTESFLIYDTDLNKLKAKVEEIYESEWGNYEWNPQWEVSKYSRNEYRYYDTSYSGDQVIVKVRDNFTPSDVEYI